MSSKLKQLIKRLKRSHLPLALFILIFAGIGTYFLISSFADPSPNIYIAQAATGSDNGTDCADAYPVSFFNTSSNWGTNTGQIGPGTTVHLCGTISTDLTAQGSGAAGSPITIYFEPGAKLSQPACAGVCLSMSGLSYITVDGGRDGIIENTANGTGLANQVASNGIDADPCSGCTIENLTIQNIYVHSSPSDTATAAGNTGGVTASGSNLTIADNTFDNMRGGVYMDETNPTDSNLRFYGNNIYDTDYGFWLAINDNAGGTGFGPFYIYDNHIHDHANWDTTNDTFHHDGLMVYSSPSGSDVGAGLYVYNNRFDGTSGTDATGDIFIPGVGEGTSIDESSNVYIFNNVFDHTDNSPGNGTLLPHVGNVRLWNNTVITSDPGAGLDLDDGGTIDLRNNLFNQGNIQVRDLDTAAVNFSPVPDYNFYANGGSNNWVCNGYYGFPSGFSNWQSCIGGGSHGTAYSGTFSLNSDESLPAGSPAIGAGTNLTSLCTGVLVALCSGYAGPPVNGTAGSTTAAVARPTTGAWDPGAYQYVPTYYVSTSGDDSNPCTQNSPCASLNAAYQEAAADQKCGATVYIDAGTYTAEQDLADSSWIDSNCSSSPIVFEAAPGVSKSSVVFSNASRYAGGISSGEGTQLNTNGASDWELENVTVSTVINLFPPTSNVTIDNVQGGAMTIDATSNVTVENSNFGPCYNLVTLSAGTNRNGYPAPTYSPNSAVACNTNFKIAGIWTQDNGSGTVYHLNNLIIKNNTIHDFIDDASNAYYDHFECMFIDGGDNITVDSNKFYDCQLYSIMIQPFSGYPVNNLTIQNNDFWADQQALGACTSDGSCTWSNQTSRDSAINFAEETSSDVTNVLIRYNSFDPGTGIATEGTAPNSASNVRIVGNIIGTSGYNPCQSGITYGYNIWQTQDNTSGTNTPCGTGGVNKPTNPFMTTGQSSDNYGSNNSMDNLSLVGSSYAQNFVTPNTSDYQLADDINGKARPANGPRDAGAEQYSTGSTDLNNDGTTNIFDLSIFLDHYGQAGSGLPGDFNGDGRVDSSDLVILQGQWGN